MGPKRWPAWPKKHVYISIIYTKSSTMYMDVSPQSHALPVVEGVAHWLSDMAGQSRLPSLGAPELSRNTYIKNNVKGL